MAIAWVFPGQGSQKPGMAEAVLPCAGARERFDQVSQLLGRDLLAICAGSAGPDGGPSDLNDTRNTQPALFTVESLLVDGLLSQGRRPDLVAGHSLGELVALYAAGVISLEDGLRLVQRRSELMAAAGGGAMTAVMGFDRDRLEALVAAHEDVVIANDNSAAQVVLSGTPEAVREVSEALGCRRAVPLAVSGAFHSPGMREPAEAFSTLIDSVTFRDARVPVISNAEPTPATDAATLRERLRAQMCRGVRWRETMTALQAAGVDTVVEIGPGNVLGGLIRRSLDGVTTVTLGSAGDLAL